MGKCVRPLGQELTRAEGLRNAVENRSVSKQSFMELARPEDRHRTRKNAAQARRLAAPD